MQNLSVVQAVMLGGLFLFVAGGALVAMLLFAPRSIQRRVQQAGGGAAPLAWRARATATNWRRAGSRSWSSCPRRSRSCRCRRRAGRIRRCASGS